MSEYNQCKSYPRLNHPGNKLRCVPRKQYGHPCCANPTSPILSKCRFGQILVMCLVPQKDVFVRRQFYIHLKPAAIILKTKPVTKGSSLQQVVRMATT
eukprot:5415982-Amphidinium_carterae.2